MASENVSINKKFCFRVFKLQLKVVKEATKAYFMGLFFCLIWVYVGMQFQPISFFFE